MPHDAIVERTVVPSVSQMTYASTYGPYEYTETGREFSSFIAREESASTNNPIRKDGSRAPSAYSALRVVISNSFAKCEQAKPVSGWYVKNGHPHPRFTNIFGDNPTTKFVVDWFVKPVGFNVENQAKTNFLLKLNERKGAGQVDLGVAVGEFAETIEMATELGVSFKKSVLTTARKASLSPLVVQRFLSDISRAQAKKVKGQPVSKKAALAKVLKARGIKLGGRQSMVFENIVDSWLTTQLGLKPLMHDVYDATVYLTSASGPVGGDRLIVPVRAGAEGDYQYRKQLMGVGWSDSCCDIDAVINQKVKVDYSCRYQIPVKADVRESLGIDNPGYVAYNLVRYTWILDYIIGVGDWLQSMTAPNHTKFVEGSMSYKRSVYLEKLETTRVFPDRPLLSDPAKAPCMVSIEKFDRVVLGAGVMPATFPSLANRLGLTQLANVVSVLKNFVR